MDLASYIKKTRKNFLLLKFQKMKKVRSILNFAVILAVIIWNYYTTIYGYNGSEVGQVSDNLPNLFTPAGYAFSIWGIIFLGLIVIGIQGLILGFKEEESGIIELFTPSLVAANVFNCVWVLLWLNLNTGFSVIVMTMLLISLILAVKTLDDLDANKHKVYRWTIVMPTRIYLGWIIVAIVANISAYLNTTSFPDFMGERIWFYLMVAIASAIILFLTWTRKWYEVGIVGVWSLGAIFMRHRVEEPSLAYYAIGFTAIIGFITIFRLVREEKAIGA